MERAVARGAIGVSSPPVKLLRSWIAGLVAVLLLTVAGAAGIARGEIAGDVQVVGFDQNFRPGVWTPLLVRLRPDAGSSGTYQIQVEQQDLDSDLVSFARTITLTAPADGAGTDQYFIVYFLPQGVRNQDGRGLPDRMQTPDLNALNNQLRVYLCDESGKHLEQLRTASTISTLEPIEARRGRKLVLYVRENGQSSAPALRELLDPNLLGINEDISFVGVTSKGLPTSALGYQAVDAVVWAAGGPPDPVTDERRYRSLREWVGTGGRLVVMQSSDWQQTAAWGEMLPVTFPKMGETQGTTQRQDLPNLTGIVKEFRSEIERSAWARLTGPHTVGLAVARPGAIVEDEVVWDPPLPRKTAWLARGGVGSGCVTYVAQDLGARQLSPNSPPPGWAKIWCHVLDYRYEPVLKTKDMKDEESAPFDASRQSLEFGKNVLNRMELTGTVGALIGVSVIFFLVYWLAAGPGTWTFLKLKGKADFSWFAFAAVAGAATVATLLVVKVVLRGSPQLHHFTLVRVARGEPALVESRMGLYVPRDGDQRVALPTASPDLASAIGPYALHPADAGDADEFPAFKRYVDNVRDVAGDEPVQIDVPYRSTAKRLQFTWRGDARAALGGQPALQKGTSLTGTLTNSSGRELANCFMAFRVANGPQSGKDMLVYLPKWKDGQEVSLAELTNLKTTYSPGAQLNGKTYSYDGSSPLQGVFGNSRAGTGWDDFLRGQMRAGRNMLSSIETRDDAASATPVGLVLLSLMDRLPFYRNDSNFNRSELLRVNARFLDTSAAVSAGKLVVIAEQSDAPLPIDMTVNGDKVGGQGLVVYQFVVPLDRSKDVPETEEDDPSTRTANAKPGETEKKK